MTSHSQHLWVFLKRSRQKIQRKREHWNAALQASLQALDDPQYDQAAQAFVVVILRFFLLQVRLVGGIVLLTFSLIFFRGALDSVKYLPFGLLFFLFAWVCLIPPFFASSLKQWKEFFVCSSPKRLTLKFLLKLFIFCTSLSMALNTAQFVWDFFGEGMAG
jgi:hypothetical protein